MPLHHFFYASPLGPIGIECDAAGCCLALHLGHGAPAPCPGNHPVKRWLDAYFAGEILPLPDMASPHTLFQARLRDALLAIRPGEAITYGELASRLGSGPRAIGQALGANPLPILIPCHRVVSATGIGGFGGGLEWKIRLLAFEQATWPENR